MSVVKIEAAGTDPAYPGSKLWDVKAATVTISKNGRKYTKEELDSAAFTLSYRPLNINHNRPDIFPHARPLEYPANSTLMAGWDKEEQAVITRVRVVDPAVNMQIEKKEINHLSVEQVSNEMCADALCNSKLQYGMAYTGLALVTNDVMPGDGKTEIKLETVPFSQITKEESAPCQKCAELTKTIEEMRKTGPIDALRARGFTGYAPEPATTVPTGTGVAPPQGARSWSVDEFLTLNKKTAA